MENVKAAGIGKDKSRKSPWQGLPHREKKASIHTLLKRRWIRSEFTDSVFRKENFPHVNTTAHSHHHSTSQAVETLQSMCQVGMPDKAQ